VVVVAGAAAVGVTVRVKASGSPREDHRQAVDGDVGHRGRTELDGRGTGEVHRLGPAGGIVWASGVLPAAVECTSTQPAPVVVVTVTV